MIDLLQQFGLTEKEAHLYTLIIQLGTAPVSTLARKTGRKRINVYNVLKQLLQKGIATEYLRQGITRYHVLSPQQFCFLQKAHLQNAHMRLEALLPQLLSLGAPSGYKPIIQVYDGLQGLKNLYEQSLKSQSIKAMLGRQHMSDSFAMYLFNEYVPLRIQKKIPTFLIYAKDSEDFYKSFIEQNNSMDHTRKILLIEDDEFSLYNSTTILSEDKVHLALFNEEEMCGISIQSKFFHDSMESIFNYIRKMNTKKQSSFEILE